MHLPKQLRSEIAENLKMFQHFSEEEENVKKKMVEKTVDEPMVLAVNERKEMLHEHRESVPPATQGNELETAQKTFSFHRKAATLWERNPSVPVPNTGISKDMNLHELKDLLEGAMGYSCDDEKPDVGSAEAELEGELLQHYGYSLTRCMPPQTGYHGTTSGISKLPSCGPQQSHKKSNDLSVQHLHDMFDEMFGFPCHGGKEGISDPMAKRPAVYAGIGKIRLVRQKHGKQNVVSKRKSCTSLPRLHKPSDMELKQLSQLLDGLMQFPCYDNKTRERKPNELEMKLYKLCGVAKIYRLPEPLNKNRMASVAFNKTSCGAEQLVQYPLKLDFENLNDLMEEAMTFFGKKRGKKGKQIQDLQDWMYRYCGIGKVRRISLNSVPHRNGKVASHVTSCNPLESSKEGTRKILHQTSMLLDEMLGFRCEEENEEEADQNVVVSRLHEYCGVGKIRFLPEDYFVNRSPSNTSKTASCNILQNLDDPLDLSLKQVSQILEETIGLPEDSTIALLGEGLYLLCALTSYQILPDSLDANQSPSDISKRNVFNPLPTI